MNSKIFGTINAASWDPHVNQFAELGTVNSYNVMNSVDVCDICKTGESVLSEGSSISIQDGCRCGKSEAPKVENTGGAVDISLVATEQKPEEEVVDPINESDYIEPSTTEPAKTATGQTYISDSDTVISAPNTESTITDAEPAPIEGSSGDEGIRIIGKDKEAFEKFCAGELSSIEYAINITIIILFIAMSVMAMLILFKLAYKSCKHCGSKCSNVCPKCGLCRNCCNCYKANDKQEKGNDYSNGYGYTGGNYDVYSSEDGIDSSDACPECNGMGGGALVGTIV